MKRGEIMGVIEEGNPGGGVPPGDPFALADAFLDLLPTPAAGRAMRHYGRVRTVAAFDNILSTAKFESILTELAAAGGRLDSVRAEVDS